MSLALDPSLKGLDDCGCGGGTARATPVAIANRPAVKKGYAVPKDMGPIPMP